MRKLEEELGFALFNRNNKRRFALTPAGRLFLDEMVYLLPQYEQAVKRAQRDAYTRCEHADLLLRLSQADQENACNGERRAEEVV